MAHLEDEHGNLIVTLGDQALLLGRAQYADLRYENDLGCSREQARIYERDGQIILEALSQNTPVYIDGSEVIGAVVVHDNAEISFSEQVIRLRVNAVAAAPAHKNPQTAPAGELVIGRSAANADLTLEHPTVSRRHAIFEAGDSASIRDLGSTNGTFVNGERISGRQSLSIGDRVDIGPFALFYDGAQLSAQSRQGTVSLYGNALYVDVNTSKGTQRILDNASVEIAACEFVCIVGPSGSGKSTLMKALSGRMPVTSGSVKFSDLDLLANFERLKQEIAFVPQHDVLHEALTLERALTYTAQLRLPKDMSSENHKALVRDAAADVDLTDRLNNKISTLSGGQKKRASLASETLAKPGLLFLDEVTSGLDEATDREIMRTLRQKADAGMTIVCVTHTLSNVEDFCDRLIVMAEGGVIAYNGPPRDALSAFSVSRLGQIFDRLKEHPLEYWRARNDSQAGVAAEQSPQKSSSAFGRIKPGQSLRQFLILTRRNIELVAADKRGLLMAATQSILIGVLVGYAFSDFGAGFEVVNSQSALMLLLGLCSIWLGCNSASQEIVSERQIFLREYDVNLSATAFVLSKFLVSAVFSAMQFVVVFFLVAFFAAEIPGPMNAQLAFLLLGSLSGTAMGILLSSLANTNEQATTIVPLTLVPQLIFAGVLVPKLPEFATYFAEIAVSGYWLTEGMKSNLINDDGPINIIDIATGQATTMTAASAHTGSLVITLHIIAFLILTVVTVIRRASR